MFRWFLFNNIFFIHSKYWYSYNLVLPWINKYKKSYNIKNNKNFQIEFEIITQKWVNLFPVFSEALYLKHLMTYHETSCTDICLHSPLIFDSWNLLHKYTEMETLLGKRDRLCWLSGIEQKAKRFNNRSFKCKLTTTWVSPH